MEPDVAASPANSDDPAIRATGEVITGLDVQKQPGSCRCDGADVDAFDTEQRIRTRASAPTGTRLRVIHVRVSLPYWFAWSLPFKEALTSFLLHHAEAAARAELSKRPNHAPLRRARNLHYILL